LILFVGGLFCYYNFKNYVENLFYNIKRKEVIYRTCKEVNQADIDNADIIIAYSYAIQYMNTLKLYNKKIILLSPLLNDYRFKDIMIKIAEKLVDTKSGITKFGTELYCKMIGVNEKSFKYWVEDVQDWVKDYGINESKIQNIEPKSDWIIIDGFKPICKLPRIDDIATDNNGNKIRHIINYDNHLLFLDKYLGVK